MFECSIIKYREEDARMLIRMECAWKRSGFESGSGKPDRSGVFKFRMFLSVKNNCSRVHNHANSRLKVNSRSRRLQPVLHTRSKFIWRAPTMLFLCCLWPFQATTCGTLFTITACANEFPTSLITAPKSKVSHAAAILFHQINRK